MMLFNSFIELEFSKLDESEISIKCVAERFVDDLIVEHLEREDIVNKISMAKWWTGGMANGVSYH